VRVAQDRDGSVAAARANRAAVHHALADPSRLEIVELLALGDRTPGELATLLGVPSNLVAFHLGELERAGIVGRRRSEGDGRRRYARLLADAVAGVPVLPTAPGPTEGAAPRVLFVCTANQARSPMAAALWSAITGTPAESAGTRPAPSSNPLVRAVAKDHGLVVDDATPRSIGAVTTAPDIVVSVCDRAHEDGLPFDVPALHWSVPDPSAGGRPAFERALTELRTRVLRLARSTAPLPATP
jgi:protein-tyrosine-phosphatase/DNA-binding transcriptional ArsR family regulator